MKKKSEKSTTGLQDLFGNLAEELENLSEEQLKTAKQVLKNSKFIAPISLGVECTNNLNFSSISSNSNRRFMQAAVETTTTTSTSETTVSTNLNITPFKSILKNAVSAQTSLYNICKAEMLTFDSTGENRLPISNITINLLKAGLSNLLTVYSDLTEKIETFSNKVTGNFDVNSGFEPSCSPLVDIIGSLYYKTENEENNQIKQWFTKVKETIDSSSSSSNFWFYCQLGNNKSLSCECNAGDCSLLGVNQNICLAKIASSDIEWEYDDITISIWRTSNSNVYDFISFSTTDGVKKYEYAINNKRSNDEICMQIQACSELLTVNNYDLEYSNACRGKMKETCANTLNSLISDEIKEVMQETAVSSTILFSDLTEPTEEFMKFVDLFLITEDGSTLRPNPILDFPSAMAYQITVDKNLRNLNEYFSDSLDADSETEISDNSKPSGETEVDGSTSTKSVNAETYMIQTIGVRVENSSNLLSYSYFFGILISIILLF